MQEEHLCQFRQQQLQSEIIHCKIVRTAFILLYHHLHLTHLQDRVPQSTTADLALPLSTQSNLPTDYDSSKQLMQQGQNTQETQRKQPIAQSSAATQNTGETTSIQSQDGRYRDIVRYTNASQFYSVAEQLEKLLLEYSSSNVTIGNFMYQGELDVFYRDGRDVNFRFTLNVYDSLTYLHRTYYAHEHEIDFISLHVDCDSADEEELDNTLPYEEPLTSLRRCYCCTR